MVWSWVLLQALSLVPVIDAAPHRPRIDNGQAATPPMGYVILVCLLFLVKDLILACQMEYVQPLLVLTQ